MNRTWFAIAICALPVQATSASSVLIDFETFPNGTPVACGTEITNQYASLGVLFSSTNTSAGAAMITNILDFVATPSPTTLLAPGGPAPNNGGTLVLEFPGLVSEAGSFFIDDQIPVQVTAFDQTNTVVGMTASDGSNQGFDAWMLAHPPGIARVELAGGFFGANTPDGWGIDDLQFVRIPEPGAILLALLSVGLLLAKVRAPRGN